MATLVLEAGSHTLILRQYEEFNGVKTARIECIDDMTSTMDEDGEWIEEQETGSYYLNPHQIDLLINALIEAKKYITT